MLVSQEKRFVLGCGIAGLVIGISIASLIASYEYSIRPKEALGQVWFVGSQTVVAFSPKGLIQVNDTSGRNYATFYPPNSTLGVRVLWNSSIYPGFEYVRYSFPNGEAIVTASFYRTAVGWSLTVYGEIPPSMYGIIKLGNVTVPQAGMSA